MNNIIQYKNIIIFIFFCFILRVLIAYINTHLFMLPGVGDDARGNHLMAYYWVINDDRSLESLNRIWNQNYFNLYEVIIYHIYFYTFTSWFWSSFLSTLMWLFSSIIFLFIFDALKTKRSSIILFYLFYGLLPSFIIYSSSTFKESVEVFLISLIIPGAFIL